jgi:hypothetical protein
MADITISKFTTQVVRTGSTPSSSGFAVNEGQDPTDPSGSGQNHLPVTIGSPANGLAVTDAQVLTIDKAQIFAGTSSQFVKGDGTLDSNTYLTTGSAAATYVPYTGATSDVNLGTHDLTAERGTFENNGSSNTLTVNHTSGSGYGIIVSKGGNNEALYVSKTSGSGNAMTVVGGRTSLVDLALSSVSNTAGDFLTLSGGVVHKRTAAEVRTDIAAGTVTSVAALTLGTSGTDLSSTVANGTTTPVITLNVPTASASNRGALSAADWTTFNNKTSNLGTVTSVGLSSATSGVTIGSTPVTTSGTITLAIATASGSQNGLLSSTDWTTFNNKQNALTNPITGTGASGQIAFFNGTNTITGESGLTWDSANNRLAIGLLSSNVPLFVSNGDVNSVVGVFTGNNAARGLQMSTYNSAVDDSGVFINAQHSSGQISLATAGNQRIIISNGSIDLRNTTLAASSVYFDTTYQDALTVNSLGRILINKTDDNGARLQVSGNASISSLAGTGTRMVVTDSNGLLSAVSNPVTGTGTTNYLPKFTGASTIGNSIVSESGTIITVAGSSRFTGFDSGYYNENVIAIGNGTNNPKIGLASISGYRWNTRIRDVGGNGEYVIRYEEGSLDALVLNRSGNLGLGVTPSAWDGNFIRAIQIGDNNGSISSFTTGNTSSDWLFLNNNALYDSGGWKYIASSGVAQYAITNSEHRWLTAPSGTAGNAISFTQAMTLGSNSGLSIGTPSAAPSQGLLVQGAATFSSSVTATELYLSTSNGLVGNINSSNANGGYLTWQTSGTTIADIGTAQQIFGAGGNDTFGINGRGARALTFGTNNTERMRITSGGNVLIGTTTNGASKLRLVGLPTSAAGLSSGDVYNLSGVLMIA